VVSGVVPPVATGPAFRKWLQTFAEMVAHDTGTDRIDSMVVLTHQRAGALKKGMRQSP